MRFFSALRAPLNRNGILVQLYHLSSPPSPLICPHLCKPYVCAWYDDAHLRPSTLEVIWVLRGRFFVWG